MRKPLMILFAVLFIAGSAQAAPPPTILVSHVPSDRTVSGNASTTLPKVTSNGRFVFFLSTSTTLVDGFVDQNGPADFDLYLFDRKRNRVSLAVHDPDDPHKGLDGPVASYSISSSGRFILLTTKATNVVHGFVNGNGSLPDVYILDRKARRTRLVTRSAGTTNTGSNGTTFIANISSNGRFVAITSNGTDLIAGFVDGNSTDPDIYRYDTKRHTMVLLSHSTTSPTTSGDSGSASVLVSSNGVVAFESGATDLVPGFIDADATSFDVFVNFRGATTLASHGIGTPSTTGDGYASLDSMDPTGRFVAFESLSTTDVSGFVDGNGPAATDVYVFDRSTGIVQLVSRSIASPSQAGNAGSNGARFVRGRSIVFSSGATDLIPSFLDQNGPGGFDEFLASFASWAVTLLSHDVANLNAGANKEMFPPAVSPSGRFVVFDTEATNLLTMTDGNGPLRGDVIALDLRRGSIRLASHTFASSTQSGNFTSTFGAVANTGVTAFYSEATDLISPFTDGNGAFGDIYLSLR